MAPDCPCNHWTFSDFWWSTPVLTHGSLTGLGGSQAQGPPHMPQRARKPT
jgi:hypothetical protein